MSEIIIVGGGVSGLSAGIYAALGGFDVSVYEKHFEVGGNLTGWERGGYKIDNCVHWLTGTNKNSGWYKTWLTLGVMNENTEIILNDSLYTVEKGGKTLTLYRDIDKTRREMLDVSIDDESEIEKFIKAVKEMMRAFHIGGKNKDEGLKKRDLIKDIPLFYGYYSISTGELTEKFKSPLIKKFLVSFLNSKFTAFALISVFATFCGDNGGLIKGGSFEMAKLIKGRFIDLGGHIYTNKEAVKITGGDKPEVLFSDGSAARADYVISAVDPKIFFGKLTDKKPPYRLKRMYEDRRYMTFSAIQCAFSCEEEKLPFNGDFIVETRNTFGLHSAMKYMYIREFSHEKSYSLSGKNIIQTMVFCDEKTSLEYISAKEETGGYKSIKSDFAFKAESVVVRQFPILKGKLKLLDVWTPATYRRFTGAPTGSFMAFTTPPKYIPFKVKSKVFGMKNVYIATQWQNPPGGLPNAALSGKRAAEEIIKRESKKRAVSAPKLNAAKPVKERG